MSNFRKFISVSAVAILGASNLLMPLSYATAADVNNYDTAGNPISTAASFSFIMPDHEVFLKAYTEANRYSVTYSGTTKTSGTMPDSWYTYDQTGTLSGLAYFKTGYSFVQWNDPLNSTGYKDEAQIKNLTTVNNGNVPIYAEWTPNTYKIDYNLNKGTGTSTPYYGNSHPTTATYDTEFTVDNPGRTGYTFSGWTITNMDTERHTVGGNTSYQQTENGVTGTRFNNLNAASGSTVHFAARWKPNQVPYKVEHYLENLAGGYPDQPETTNNLTGTADTSVTPATGTYTGFTPNAANTPTSGNIEPDGSKVFRYEYTRNSYDLTLRAGRGVASVKGTGTVNTVGISTSSNQTKQFKYDEPVKLSFVLKSGYTGGQWSGDLGNVSSFEMPANDVDKTAYADPIDYQLTVKPRGGSGATDRTTYTVEDADIPLGNPTRDHSTFEGWTGGVNGQGITSPTKGVKVANGSTGNREYSAVWSCVIGYHLENTGANNERCEADTNTRYLVNHIQQDLDGEDTIYIDTGYEYGQTATTTNVTGNTYDGFELRTPIAQQTIKGDDTTVVNVYYDRLSYTGTIANPSGVDAGSIHTTATGEHPTGTTGSYKFEDKVTINAALEDGYIFNGWTVKDASGNSVTVTNSGSLTNATFQMPASSVTITPKVTKIGYTISYELHSGSVATANKTGYNVETDTFTLTNPTRAHSDFVGWSGGIIGEESATSASVTILQGSVGDRLYEAIWKCHTGYHANGLNECVANDYTVHIDLNYPDGTDTPYTEPFKYDTTGTIANPQQSGYDFAGWTVTGLSGGNATVDGHPIDNGSTTSGTRFNNLTTEKDGDTVTLTATWTPKNNTKYKVYHYYEDLNADTYTLSGTFEYEGTTATRVTFSPEYVKNKSGFMYVGGYTTGGTNRPTNGAVLDTDILKDGSRKIYLYYQRRSGDVYLSGDANVAALYWKHNPEDQLYTGARRYEYEDTVSVRAEPAPGYHFKQWRRKTNANFTTDYTGSTGS